MTGKEVVVSIKGYHKWFLWWWNYSLPSLYWYNYLDCDIGEIVISPWKLEFPKISQLEKTWLRVHRPLCVISYNCVSIYNYLKIITQLKRETWLARFYFFSLLKIRTRFNHYQRIFFRQNKYLWESNICSSTGGL